MNLEHIVYGISVELKETDHLATSQINEFQALQFEVGSRRMAIPHTRLSILAHQSVNGATFLINKGDAVVLRNICCFEQFHTEANWRLVHQLGFPSDAEKSASPIFGMWLCSIPINVLTVNEDEFRLAVNIAPIIYLQLYLGRQTPDSP